MLVFVNEALLSLILFLFFRGGLTFPSSIMIRAKRNKVSLFLEIHQQLPKLSVLNEVFNELIIKVVRG